VPPASIARTESIVTISSSRGAEGFLTEAFLVVRITLITADVQEMESQDGIDAREYRR
jgi:hypothetical protein